MELVDLGVEAPLSWTSAVLEKADGKLIIPRKTKKAPKTPLIGWVTSNFAKTYPAVPESKIENLEKSKKSVRVKLIYLQ